MAARHVVSDPASPPATLDELTEHIRQRLQTLPKKLQRVARAVLNTPESVAFGSVRELAGELAINTATVVRFAQIFGYTGYQPLRSVVRRGYLLKAGLQPSRDLELADSQSAVTAMMQLQQANLDTARRRLDLNELDAMATALIGARRIFITGTGGALVVAGLFARLLRQVGLYGAVVPAGGADLPIALHDLGNQDLVVGISLWIQYTEVLTAMEFARGARATTIAIVGSPASPSIELADHALVVPSQSGPLAFSVVAAVAMVEVLVARIAEQRPEVVKVHDQTIHDWLLRSGMMAPLVREQEPCPLTPRRRTPQKT